MWGTIENFKCIMKTNNIKKNLVEYSNNNE